MAESKQWTDKNGVTRAFKDEVARNALANKISSISVNGVAQTMDANKNVDISVITNAVNDLINYYNKYTTGGTKSTSTYSAEEIDQLISTIPKFDIKIVASLPTGLDISTSTIYLVAGTSTGTNNIYAEYVYVNNAWEKLGEQVLTITVDSTPTSGSTNPVSSGGVYTAINNVVETTTTDPGEGVAMTSQLLVVYEV